MSDKPIVFSRLMIPALLSGQKTQERRALNVQPPSNGYELSQIISSTNRKEEGNVHFLKIDRTKGFPNVIDGTQRSFKFPYAVGDRLYVREALNGLGEPDNRRKGIVRYSVDGEMVLADRQDWLWRWDSPRLPAHQMPRRFSRMTLLVTGVRIQRLSEISVDDAVEEGVCETVHYNYAEHKVAGGAPWSSERLAYANLWNDIYGIGSWEADPMVVAITFDVHHCNIDEMGKATP